MPAFFQLPNHSAVNAVINIVVSHRADGDFNSDVVDIITLHERRRALVDLPWTQLNEVHGPRKIY